MFGYVRPALGRMDEEDRARYQQAYCGLCHTMGRRHGWLARFTLNYDFTFLAVLLYGADGGTEVCRRRCPAHPLRKPAACLCGPGLAAAADESIILTWYKLTDDIADHGKLVGLFYRGVRRLFRRAYRRAAAARPEFDRQVREGMERLSEYERVQSPQMDRVADSFASILAAAAQECAGGERVHRVLEQLLYHLGRWIYLVDAWEDLGDDGKHSRYNPLDARFEGKAQAERAYVETTLSHSARLAADAADLAEFGSWKPIIDNVLNIGLPVVQGAVLDGRWKEMRRTREKNTYERSI